MCGISGIIYSDVRPTALGKKEVHEMNDLLSHRGPDNEGLALFNTELNVIPPTSSENVKVGFGHRRLSIIDLSTEANQPMFDDKGNFVFIFNGEIFNFLEIRNELIQEGIVFKTNSDTEVILKGYIHWGHKLYDKLEGMWAFALLNKKDKSVILSRDRNGIKPLFYSTNSTGFWFASEIKALLPFCSVAINQSSFLKFAIDNEFSFGKETFFENIFEIEPGHEIKINIQDGKVTKYKYFEPKDLLRDNDVGLTSINTASEELYDILKTAILQHSRADVPIGACLSGGLDSSTIVAFLRNLQPDIAIPVFSALFDEKLIDESALINASIQKHDLKLFSIQPNSEGFLSTLEDVAYTQEFPLISTSTFAQYQVMQEANNQNIKVLINGQGADELLGGYFRYGLFQQQKLLSKFKIIEAHRGPANFSSQLKSVTKTIINRSSNNFLNGFLNKDYSMLPSDLASRFESTPKTFSNLNEVLLDDYYNGYLTGLLRAEDRNSMRFSIESRVPFASSHLLAKWAFSMPSSFKYRTDKNKPLLRSMLFKHDLIPKTILEKKTKLGFSTPMNKWIFQNEPALLQYLDFIPTEIVDVQRLKKHLKSEIRKNRNNVEEQPRIFKWISLGVWFKVFKIT